MLHYMEGLCTILSNLSRLQHLVTPAQIAEGKKLVEPTEVSHEEEDKVYFLDKNTLVFMMMVSRNALSVISTYLTPHIWMRIH
jgi:hypothetical protein